MLVDKCGILTEGNGGWELFVALAPSNCAVQYRIVGTPDTLMYSKPAPRPGEQRKVSLNKERVLST
jgi:hypothetical protein